MNCVFKPQKIHKKYFESKCFRLIVYFNFWRKCFLFVGPLIPLVMSSLNFKAREDPSLVCFLTWKQWIPWIHLWRGPLVTSIEAKPFKPTFVHMYLHKHWWSSNP